MKKSHEVMVICDAGKCDRDHILQIISKARSLADGVGYKTAVLCVGNYEEEGLSPLAECGADTILFYRHCGALEIGTFTDIADHVLARRKPEVVLYPATDFGKAIAASMSVRFRAGLTADCVDIETTKEKDFLFVRAAINNTVLAKIKCINSEMKMCTIKKDVFTKKNYPGDKAAVQRIACEIKPKKGQAVEVLELIKKDTKKNVDIGKYPVVFCIGRGVKDIETRDRIASLAKSFGAAIVGTRAAVEEALVTKEYQVGQSGKNIAPRIYVGFGVSGASQHMVGIRNTDIIIAINSDENAAIFEYADYVVAEDLNVIVKEMEILLHKELVSA